MSTTPPANQSAFGAPTAGTRPPAFVLGTVFASVLALVGGILPWFHPKADGTAIPGADEIHVWQAGKIGLVGPILLIVVGVLWIKEYLSPSADAEAKPKLALMTLGAGALGLVAVVFAWFMSTKQYKDWDENAAAAKELGISLTRGPQAGFWLTVVASLIALGIGAYATLTMRKK